MLLFPARLSGQLPRQQGSRGRSATCCVLAVFATSLKAYRGEISHPEPEGGDQNMWNRACLNCCRALAQRKRLSLPPTITTIRREETRETKRERMWCLNRKKESFHLQVFLSCSCISCLALGDLTEDRFPPHPSKARARH